MQPFISVLPPLMTDPPRDTECADVPDGPQAQTYLTKDVPAALEHSYRVDAPGRAWSVAGWSTGGFCAAKLGLSDPSHWGTEISFGGYFKPIIDRATGDLFHGDAELRQRGTPLWLYRQHGTGGTRLLMVAGSRKSSLGGRPSG